MKRRFSIHQLLPLAMTLLFCLSVPCFAEAPATSIGDTPKMSATRSESVDALKKQIILDKKKLNVMENMQLSSEEARSFWPIYHEYQEQLIDLSFLLTKLFSFYIVSKNSLSNQQASTIMDEMFTISDSRQDVLKRFSLALEDVLPAKRVFHYMLIENNQAVIEQYELLRQIPLPE